jgi:hypothetical protein
MKKEDILAASIEEIRAGRSTLQECVSRHPDLREELESLLKLTSSLKSPDVTLSEEFRIRARSRILAAAAAAPGLACSSPRPRRTFLAWPEPAFARVLASVLVAVVLLGATGGGAAYASQRSLPGDFLYPVKTGVERLQMAATSGAAAKADLHVTLADRRLEEAAKLIETGRPFVSGSLESAGRQLDSAIDELSKSTDVARTEDALKHMSAVTFNKQLELSQTLSLSSGSANATAAIEKAIDDVRRGNTIAGVAYANQDLLKQRPSVKDEKLDMGQFRVEGILVSVHSHTWNVGGTEIKNVHFSGSTPAIGSRVKLEGLTKDSQVFLSRVEVIGNSAAGSETKVEGQFSGTETDGKARVGGIPVKIAEDKNSQLTPGDRVSLEGKSGADRLNVTDKKSQKDQSPTDVGLSGVLTAVDVREGTVTVRTAGNQIKVYVAEARITGDGKNGKSMSISDASRLIGRDVRFGGLYKKDNLTYARSMQIAE